MFSFVIVVLQFAGSRAQPESMARCMLARSLPADFVNLRGPLEVNEESEAASDLYLGSWKSEGG